MSMAFATVSSIGLTSSHPTLSNLIIPYPASLLQQFYQPKCQRNNSTRITSLDIEMSQPQNKETYETQEIQE